MRLTPLILMVCTLTLPAFAKAKHKKVVAVIKTSTGKDAGTATFKQEGDKLQISLDLKNLPPGLHGFHVHQHALCEAPDFKSAGPHFDPVSHQHTNVTVDIDGTAHAKYSVAYLSLGTGQPNDILANGGTAFMLHEKADDMVTDPTGNAGNRIACGVILGAEPPTASPAPAN